MTFSIAELKFMNEVDSNILEIKLSAPSKSNMCRVHNMGLEIAYIYFSDRQDSFPEHMDGERVYCIPSGKTLDCDKSVASYISAKTLQGTTQLIIEAGRIV